jgi:hypothetical protein
VTPPALPCAGSKTAIEQAIVDMRLIEGGTIEEWLKAVAATDERVAGFLRACESPRWDAPPAWPRCDRLPRRAIRPQCRWR